MKEHNEFEVDLERIAERRTPGISGFMRIRNEEEFLPQAIESHIPYLDELVIVYNRCTDKSEEIIKDYESKFKKKIKSYNYLPHVYPMGSGQYHKLPHNSVHSFINYSNYALARTTRQIVVKIDGDDIAIPVKIKFITDKIREGFLERDSFWVFTGINLWRKGDKIYVNGRSPFPGLDHGFFFVDENTVFMKGRECEYLGGNLKMKTTGYMYYHAKGLKKAKGVSNYDLKENPDSYYGKVSYTDLCDDELLTFEEFVMKYSHSEELQYLPPPKSYIRL